MLISLELELAHSSRVLGAVRIALKRAELEVWRPIPRTSIQRVEEGRVDSEHVEDLSQHPECTRIMLMAPRAETPMLSREKKVHGCQTSKQLSVPCTREFAVNRERAGTHDSQHFRNQDPRKILRQDCPNTFAFVATVWYAPCFSSCKPSHFSNVVSNASGLSRFRFLQGILCARKVVDRPITLVTPTPVAVPPASARAQASW